MLAVVEVAQPDSPPVTEVTPVGSVTGWVYWKVGPPPSGRVPVTVTASGSGVTVNPPSTVTTTYWAASAPVGASPVQPEMVPW